jgi:hypothetical protein
MTDLPYSSDDLPPSEFTQSDQVLHHQLEDVVRKYFYQACDGVTQSLLIRCEWLITITAHALTLVINCPDMSTNWRVLNNLVAIGGILAPFAPTGKLRICPPPGTGIPLEIRVDEISVYRDLL